MSEPVCADCGAAMRPAGDRWYCHACLGDDSAASASESASESGGESAGESGGEPGGRHGLAAALVAADPQEVSRDE